MKSPRALSATNGNIAVFIIFKLTGFFFLPFIESNSLEIVGIYWNLFKHYYWTKW
jgi:hypothetical protein